MQIEMEKYLKNSLKSSLDFKENIINCIVWLNENKINSNDDINYIKKKDEFIKNIKNSFQKCKNNSLYITHNNYIQNINKVNGNIYDLLFDISDFKFNPPNINSINVINNASNNISNNISLENWPKSLGHSISSYLDKITNKKNMIISMKIWIF